MQQPVVLLSQQIVKEDDFMKRIVHIIIVSFIILSTLIVISPSTEIRDNHSSLSTPSNPSILKDKPPSYSLGDDKKNINEPTGNITNLGLAVEDKGRIYYSDGVGLFVMKKDGTQVVQLVDEPVMNIQISQDRVYYIKEETSEIYRINKDGTQKKKISSDKAYSLNIYKDKIYFMDRYNQLYITSLSLDGQNKTVIHETITNDIMVYDDYIYYITKNGDLGKVKIDGSEYALLDTDVMQFDVSSGGIYYIYDPRKVYRPRGLYQLDFNGGSQVQLMEETPYSFNVYDEAIYYNHPVKMSLYSMHSNGTQKTQITGTNTSAINLAGDYIFYRNLEDEKKIYRIDKDGSNRKSLQGTTKITSVVDLTKEIDQLEGKEFLPKLERAYNEGKQIISEIIKHNMTEYEKVKKIHDYIIQTTSYDQETAENFLLGNNTDGNAFTAYGVLINKKGVCQGYAEAAQILFTIAGIESELVIGSVRDEGGTETSHMWNMVWVDGKNYMIDVTWDDPIGDRDMLVHDYFLVDDQTLKQTHHWVYDEYPSCD